MNEDSVISRRRKTALTDGSADYKVKRDELVGVAAKLFKQKGYRATTLGDVAKHSGLDRATLYYYISSKEELLQEAVKGVLDNNLAEAERLLRTKTLDAREKLLRIFEILMASYEENYPHTYVYIQELMQKVDVDPTPWAKDMAKQTHRFEGIVMTLINQCVADAVFRDDVPVDLAANALFGMFNWTHRWYKPGGKQTARNIAEAFCKIFCDGMQQKKTRPGAEERVRSTSTRAKSR
ncbi:TetR/AcrR family transcriptional regulator [Pandoraea terrae]